MIKFRYTGKVFVGIRNGKIFDIVDRMENRKTRTHDEPVIDYENEVQYFEATTDEREAGGWEIGDSFDFNTRVHIPDAPKRFAEPEKTPDQIKIAELEERIKTLEELING